MDLRTEQRLIADVRQIKIAITGDELTKQPGLAGRLAKVENWVRKADLRNAWITGIVVTGIFVIKWLFLESH